MKHVHLKKFIGFSHSRLILALAFAATAAPAANAMTIQCYSATGKTHVMMNAQPSGSMIMHFEGALGYARQTFAAEMIPRRDGQPERLGLSEFSAAVPEKWILATLNVPMNSWTKPFGTRYSAALKVEDIDSPGERLIYLLNCTNSVD